MERREIAESALKQLCERINVRYTTETQPLSNAWFLESVTRGRVNIMQWQDDVNRSRGINGPLGSYGLNLTHEQVYDRCWFADRILTTANPTKGK